MFILKLSFHVQYVGSKAVIIHLVDPGRRATTLPAGFEVSAVSTQLERVLTTSPIIATVQILSSIFLFYLHQLQGD
jgi:hypothetical protein